MTSEALWRRAQSYERCFWEGVSEQITQEASAGIDAYGWRAGRLRRMLRPLELEQIAEGTVTGRKVGDTDGGSPFE